MNVLDKSQPIYDRIEQLRERLRKRDKNVSTCVDGSGQKTEINWFEEYTWGVWMILIQSGRRKINPLTNYKNVL